MIQILQATETEAAIASDLIGNFQSACDVYASDEVILQFRVSPDRSWVNARQIDGTEIKWTQAGMIFEITLAEAFDYRVITTTAGAEIFLAPQLK